MYPQQNSDSTIKKEEKEEKNLVIVAKKYGTWYCSEPINTTFFFCTKACRFIKMNIIMVNISCKLKNVYYDRDIEKYRHFVNTSHEFCVLTI